MASTPPTPPLASWLAGRNAIASATEVSFASADVRMVRGSFRSTDRPAERDISFPALTVQILTRGQLSFEADLGCGRFGGKTSVGAAIVTPPSQACDIQSDGDFESMALAIPFALVEALLAPLDGGRMPDLSPLYAGVQRSTRLNAALEELWTEIAAKRGADRILVQAGVLSTLGSLFEMTALPRGRQLTGGLSPARLTMACDAMDAGENVTLVELAALVGLSPSHFGRAFRQSTGMSPSAWLLHRRIDRAKDLLRKAELPLVQIALDVGFSAQPQFTTAFKRVTGVSPIAWRRLSG